MYTADASEASETTYQPNHQIPEDHTFKNVQYMVSY